jgi:hypothetical protein
MGNLFYDLPADLQRQIYEYDPTYRKKYDEVMRQLNRLLFITITEFWWIDVLDDRRLHLHLRAVAKRYKKKELRDLCRFNFIRPPHKHTTKWKLCLSLFVKLAMDAVWLFEPIFEE